MTRRSPDSAVPLDAVPTPHSCLPRRPSRRSAALLVLVGLVVSAACSTTEASSPASTAGTDPTPTTSPVVSSSAVSSTTAPTTAPPTTAAPTTVPPTPLLRTPSPEQPLDTLIIGDSTAYEVGNAVLRANTDGLLLTEVLFKTSSGLARPDFFDWPFYLGFVADNNPPELMVLSLGANDGQDLRAPDGTIHLLPSDGWRAEYLRRVDEVSQRITAAGTTLYWIGQPLALDPVYSEGMAIINSVYAEVAERYDDVEFVDIWEVLAGPDGGYAKVIEGPDGQPIEIRAEDDIHLTEVGADLAAQHVMDRLREGWGG